MEKNALELKGKWIGHTGPKVVDAFQDAMGGTLFLDEAYALAGGSERGSDNFSNEAIRTMLTQVENNRSSVFVILAGYSKPMQRLLDADRG